MGAAARPQDKQTPSAFYAIGFVAAATSLRYRADLGRKRCGIIIGLDSLDRRYLRCVAENYAGGPVGVETMAAALGEQRDVLEEVIEPYLLQEGFIQRTPRGRMLTELAFRHLDLAVPTTLPAQLDLLGPMPAEVLGEETP